MLIMVQQMSYLDDQTYDDHIQTLHSLQALTDEERKFQLRLISMIPKRIN